MQSFLRDYLEIHGYWVVFVGTFLEGEAILIMAGFLAFEGYLGITGVIGAAFAGSVLGDQFYFHLGRWRGRRLLHFRWVAHRLRRVLELVEKYGTFVAFISRFTYGLRILLPLILGMTRFPDRRFFPLNVASALCWATLFSFAGYLFGKSATYFVGDPHRYEAHLMVALFGIIAAAWGIHFLIAWRKSRRGSDTSIKEGT